MKIGIMTFIDYRNYGNRLQNYALQELLKEQFDAEVETIMHDKYRDYKYTDKYLKELPGHIVRSVFWRIYDFVFRNNRALGYIWQSDELEKKRIEQNIKFTDNHICESKYIVHEGNMQKKELADYDFVVTGSDQVWNPVMDGAASEIYFLRSVPKGKRIAFAASIGVDKIPPDKECQWKEYVNGIDYISVREKTAKALLKKYTSKNITVMLDPTMLVDDTIWQRLMKEKKTQLPQHYIATYVLGELDEINEEALNSLARERGCEIIRMNNRKEEDTYIFDAIDFLNCINQAEMIITDSFHACVFSILFGRNFFVLKRKGQYEDIYSRISDLLERFKMEHKSISNISKIDCTVNTMFQCDVRDILNEERNKAKDFCETLRQNIKDNNEV